MVVDFRFGDPLQGEGNSVETSGQRPKRDVTQGADKRGGGYGAIVIDCRGVFGISRPSLLQMLRRFSSSMVGNDHSLSTRSLDPDCNSFPGTCPSLRLCLHFARLFAPITDSGFRAEPPLDMKKLSPEGFQSVYCGVP